MFNRLEDGIEHQEVDFALVDSGGRDGHSNGTARSFGDTWTVRKPLGSTPRGIRALGALIQELRLVQHRQHYQRSQRQG
jgi:hypothetical protein